MSAAEEYAGLSGSRSYSTLSPETTRSAFPPDEHERRLGTELLSAAPTYLDMRSGRIAGKLLYDLFDKIGTGVLRMQFVVGPPPDTPDFTPEREGWQQIRVPTPARLLIVGSVVGIPLAASVALGWSRWFSMDTPLLQMDVTALGPLGAMVPLGLLLAGLVSFGGLIALHELVHALACPRFGLSSATTIGIWPSRFLPYADYRKPLLCWRFIIVAAAPFVVISLIPLAFAHATGLAPKSSMVLSVVNALVSGGDALICFVMLAQVPLDAMVQSKRWDIWWRPA